MLKLHRTYTFQINLIRRIILHNHRNYRLSLILSVLINLQLILIFWWTHSQLSDVQKPFVVHFHNTPTPTENILNTLNFKF